MRPDELRAWRVGRQLTQAEAERWWGIERPTGRTWRRWERGERSIPAPLAHRVRHTKNPRGWRENPDR